MYEGFIRFEIHELGFKILIVEATVFSLKYCSKYVAPTVTRLSMCISQNSTKYSAIFMYLLTKWEGQMGKYFA